MEIKEFYDIQEKWELTKYKNSNLEVVMDLINNKGIKPPITTYNQWNLKGYKIIKGNKAKGYIKYPIDKKQSDNKDNFRTRAIFGFNQVEKKEKKPMNK